jgi:tetratricopeptide (TPR) repeat protein
MAMGGYFDALQSALRTLALYQTLRDRAKEADTLLLLGSLQQAAGNIGAAIEQYEHALSLYRALRDRAKEARSLSSLAALYEAQGADREARDARLKAGSLIQSSSP